MALGAMRASRLFRVPLLHPRPTARFWAPASGCCQHGTMPAAASAASPLLHFEDEVSLEIRDGVALVTLTSTTGEFPWGTKKEEHRWNPVTVRALGKALDEVEKNEEANVVVLANEGKFWSNGMDLKYLDAAPKDAHEATLLKEHGTRVNELLARVCCFPLPTIAAFAGHWCAAGGMMGLAFDYRVMSSDRGFFFIPGVDLGLVYAPTQIELMKAKLPRALHREVILFNTKRWTAQDLAAHGVVEAAVPASEVLPKALELAASLRAKGQGAARRALGGIKRGVYSEMLKALKAGEDMGYAGRTKGVDRAAPAATNISKL